MMESIVFWENIDQSVVARYDGTAMCLTRNGGSKNTSSFFLDKAAMNRLFEFIRDVLEKETNKTTADADHARTRECPVP